MDAKWPAALVPYFFFFLVMMVHPVELWTRINPFPFTLYLLSILSHNLRQTMMFRVLLACKLIWERRFRKKKFMCRDVIENPRDCHCCRYWKCPSGRNQRLNDCLPKGKKKNSVKFAVSILRLKFLVTNSLVWWMLSTDFKQCYLINSEANPSQYDSL